MTKVVRVPSNDPANPSIQLKISATIEELLGFSPSGLSLGDVERGQVLTRSFELTGKFAPTAKLLELESPPNLAIQMVEKKEGDKRQVELTITVGKDAPTETVLNGRVQIKTDQTEMPVLRLNLRARVVGNITVQPQRVHARTTKPAESVTLRFSVVARNGKGFSVVSVADQAGRFTGVAKASADKRTHAVEVVVPAELMTRSFSGALVVKTNDKETPELKVPFSVVVQVAGARGVPNRARMQLDRRRPGSTPPMTRPIPGGTRPQPFTRTPGAKRIPIPKRTPPPPRTPVPARTPAPSQTP